MGRPFIEAAASDHRTAHMQKIEYRVRPVTRYIVTRYEENGNAAGSSRHGEFENEATAYAVGYALCLAEHDRLGWPIGDGRITYPNAVPEKDALTAAAAFETA